MAAAEDIDLNQEGREKREGQGAESLPESAEGTAELVASEDAAVSEQAERDASDLGSDGADAAAELRIGVEAEERQTMDSIAMMLEATKMMEAAGKTGDAELSRQATEKFNQALELSLKENAAQAQAAEDEMSRIRKDGERDLAQQQAESNERMRELMRQAYGSIPEAGAPDAAPGSTEDLAAMQERHEQERRQQQEEYERKKQEIIAATAEKERQIQAQYEADRARLETELEARRAEVQPAEKPVEMTAGAQTQEPAQDMEMSAPPETEPMDDEDIVDLEPPEMTGQWTAAEEAERAAEAASVLGRTERLDPAAAAERAQELMALAAQETDEDEKKRLMDEAWEINKQALRTEKTDESGGPAAAAEHEEKEPSAPDVLDSLMPEGASDEWEALSFAGGTIEDQVKREERAAERAVRDRINKERSEAVRNMGELQAEMKKAGIDIIKLEDILSDPDTASENLDAYDDRVLEKYRELLSRQMTTIGIGKRSLEITADDARKEMSAIEDEDRESGMEASEDGTSALARFIDVENQLDVAEEHLKEIEKDIEETDDPEKKSALETEAHDLKEHVRSLEDAGSAIIDSAGAKEQQDGFIDRIERFKTKKALLEQSLTDIEVLVGLELQSAAQADLLDAIMIEERDLSVGIEVDESGDEVAREIPADVTDVTAVAAATMAPEKKPAPPKKPTPTGSNLTRIGSGMPTRFKEESKDKKETLGETAKRYAKETWQDITSILNDIMKNIPGV